MCAFTHTQSSTNTTPTHLHNSKNLTCSCRVWAAPQVYILEVNPRG